MWDALTGRKSALPRSGGKGRRKLRVEALEPRTVLSAMGIAMGPLPHQGDMFRPQPWMNDQPVVLGPELAASTRSMSIEANQGRFDKTAMALAPAAFSLDGLGPMPALGGMDFDRGPESLLVIGPVWQQGRETVRSVSVLSLSSLEIEQQDSSPDIVLIMAPPAWSALPPAKVSEASPVWIRSPLTSSR
jgi:hypothetical protein